MFQFNSFAWSIRYSKTDKTLFYHAKTISDVAIQFVVPKVFL